MDLDSSETIGMALGLAHPLLCKPASTIAKRHSVYQLENYSKTIPIPFA